MMTVTQVAEQLQVSKSIVYALIEARQLRCHRIGLGRGTIRVSEADLAAYLGQSRAQEKPRLSARPINHLKL
jgi:excisionase family DNA binding protein